MFIVRSRTGYGENGRRQLCKDDEVFDIESDGRVIKHIGARLLFQMCLTRAAHGRPPLYANIVDVATLVDPDLLFGKRVGFSIEVDKSGNVDCGDSSLVSCRHVVQNSSYDFTFEFKNGVVVPLHMFCIRGYSDDFSTISFNLFEHNETFSFGKDFKLSIDIVGYGDDIVRGTVVVHREFINKPSEAITLGDIVLRRDETVYKGERLPIVYDRARYAKELAIKG